jgi:outer membrane receptor protein involved in Fe transport
MHRTLLLTFPAIILFFSSAIFSQTGNTGSIKGTVVDDSTRAPLEFVNVLLLVNEDSNSVSGTITDKSGRFEIDNVPAGKFFVKLSLIGYKERRTKSFIIDATHKKLNLGNVAMVMRPVNMNEVTVTAEKALLNNSIDRKVYNVESDVMSKSGSASEILQNVPSIQVDIDGNVSLRGSSNVRILVDGKTSQLMDKNSAEVLQQMPANSIERIEVITNPSAKYKPDGTGGLINIVMKKNALPGVNGSVTANAGNKERYNSSIRLNYKPDNFNVYGSYSIRKDNRNRFSTDLRTQTDASMNISSYDQYLQSLASPLSQSGMLGMDYRMDESNTFGISGNIFHNGFTRIDTTHNYLRNGAGMLTGNYDRTRDDPEYENEYEMKGTYEHKFPGEDHALQAEFSASKSPEMEDNHYMNNYYFPATGQTWDNTVIKQTDSRSQLSLDYTGPLDSLSKLEAGYAGEFNHNDFDYHADSLDAALGQFVTDNGKSNRFLYDEYIHALYGTISRSFGALRIKAGIRPELVLRDVNLVTRDSAFTNNYFNIYPSIHFAYKLTEIAELQLNYSRRTNRPEGEDLNPFPEYRDPRNIQAGNPNLLPEYIHSLGLGCQFEYEHLTVLPGIYYRYTYNKFTTLTEAIDDTTLLTTRKNLATDQSAGFELTASGNFGELFTANLSSNAFYEQIDASNLGYGDRKSVYSWSGNMTVNAHLTKTLNWQINSSFNSARLTAQGENAPSYVVNTGIRQQLMDGRLSLTMTVADIFRTQKRELDLNTPALTRAFVGKRDAGIIYFGLTYHFDTPPKSNKEEQMKYDDGM